MLVKRMGCWLGRKMSVMRSSGRRDQGYGEEPGDFACFHPAPPHPPLELVVIPAAVSPSLLAFNFGSPAVYTDSPG